MVNVNAYQLPSFSLEPIRTGTSLMLPVASKFWGESVKKNPSIVGLKGTKLGKSMATF